MRIISPSQKREVFGWREGDEFFLSPVAETANTRRPINRYDTEQELLAAANAKNCRVTWLTS